MKIRWLGFIAALIVVTGLWRLRFDTDVLNLLPNDLPAVAGLKLYQQNFSNRREVIVTVESDSSSAAEQAAKILAETIRSNLNATAIWQPPWMEDARGTAEFLAWLWLSQPPEKVADLREKLKAANAPKILSEARDQLTTSLSPLDIARLGRDPFGLTQIGDGNQSASQGEELFASADGTFRLIFVQPSQEPRGFSEWGTWIKQLQTAIDSAATRPDWPANTTFGLTGSPVFTVETAQGMQGDMKQSILFTLLAVAALFWWAHRRFWPLLWMLVMLVSSLLFTMAVGGLVFGNLNVVSFGFAAILLGLGVDYALVLYQELLGSPGASAREVREHAAAGIWWSASTTALAFALLNFAGLPGLGQLGTLVAVGIMVAATAMLYGFLPMMTRRPPSIKNLPTSPSATSRQRPAWIATALIAIVSVLYLARSWPGIDHSAEPLSTINSQAAKVAKRIDTRMSRSAQTDWLITQGATLEEVRLRLQALSEELKPLTNADFKIELPLAIWPRADWQKINLIELRDIDLATLNRAAEEAGFTDEAMSLTAMMTDSWNNFAKTGDAWPSLPTSRWLLDRVASKTTNGWLAMGLLQAGKDTPLPALKTPGAYIASWVHLAEALLAKVKLRMIWLTLGMAAILLICLRLALRGWTEVALSFLTLAFGFMLTLVAMSLLGWKWNLLSLTAIPLLLGAGVDYTIHVQMALRRYHGNAVLMRRTIGKALILVTAAAVAGFGSLGLASNAGLASFELVCAIGMISVFVSALYLLPAWHYTFTKKHG